ncbi:cell wall-associated NlpC family hydrolase [Rhodococcus sp. SMB37]|uniref:NlpC/P60 family protein n=1 Tax=Rhodococcus sp. SMB37 TaxID=2512213 RepID=UPI0010F01D24|nr:NlpC/P60 family protein [Rhodococcus sp. SMB37]TCN57957.1 cell wall-associated NlpC family hydrolase [Rhodococcus sp. SMB37]
MSSQTRRRVPRLLAGLGLITTVLVGLGSTAGAVPPPPPNPSDSELDAAGDAVNSGVDRIGSLIVQIAGADQQLAELDAQVAIKREDVNRALVDLQSARDAADAAAQEVAASELALQDAGARIRHVQDDFDDFARSSYTQGVNGASLASFLSTDGPDDLLDRAQVMRLLSSGRTAVLDALERARATEANSNSRARAAKLDADAAAAAAEQRRSEAEAAISTARAALEAQTSEKHRIEQERAQAQAALDHARTNVAGLEGQRAEYVAWDDRRRAEDAAAAAAAQVAAQAASEAAVRVAADAAARARAAELSNGQRPHTQLDIPAPTVTAPTVTGPNETEVAETETPETEPTESDGTDTGTEPDDTGGDTGTGTDTGNDEDDDVREWTNPDPADETGPSTPRESSPRSSPRTTQRPTLTGTAAVETVIDRGLSQIGVPYAWGGGDENGPTRGIRDGGVADSYGDYNKVGFDCSGLMIYAFAGIGVSLPHYTGYQYTAGTQVPASEMKRGDMIFYGPNASQHVGLYLGDGTMLEAPQSGAHVKISPVRWDGMTPYVVRMVS